jgi:hypothetical protein
MTDKQQLPRLKTSLREELAALEHDQWAHWMKYFISKTEVVASIFHHRIQIIMQQEDMDRWERQWDTPYAELSEKEKDSDRNWADKVLEIVKVGLTREEIIALVKEINESLEDTLDLSSECESRIRGEKDAYLNVLKMTDDEFELEFGKE